MYGYYYNSQFFGVWDSENAAAMAAEQAGHYGYSLHQIRLVNDPRPAPTAGGRLSADAQFLALGQ